MSFKDEVLALPEPVRSAPAVPVGLLPKLTRPGALREALMRDPDEEERRVMEQQKQSRKVEAPIRRSLAAVPSPPPAPPVLRQQIKKGHKGLSEYCKCKQSYWLEYRKNEAGEWHLHHADTHLMEQLAGLPVSQHRARMEAMCYTFVGRSVI